MEFLSTKLEFLSNLIETYEIFRALARHQAAKILARSRQMAWRKRSWNCEL